MTHQEPLQVENDVIDKRTIVVIRFQVHYNSMLSFHTVVRPSFGQFYRVLRAVALDEILKESN